MLRCREAARLSSESLDRELPLRQRLGLAVHLWMCSRCAEYGRQLRQLREFFTQETAGPAGPGLGEDERKALLEAVLAAADSPSDVP